MKPYACAWSYYKIHPGRGLRYVRLDSKQFAFLSKKSRAAFLRKGNPRKCQWTAVYRRLHHKGATNQESKKTKARKAEKTERAIVGASVEFLRKIREQKPEERKKVIRSIKAKKQEAAGDKKADAAGKKDAKAPAKGDAKAPAKGAAAAPKKDAAKKDAAKPAAAKAAPAAAKADAKKTAAKK